MEDSFVDLLQSLTDDTEPATAVSLVELSDLDAESLAQFAQVWKELPADRRHTILEELGLMADAQIELTFEAINRYALGDPDSAVRLQAIENLWESEDPELGARFATILYQDEQAEVRAAAGKALGAFILIGETRKLSADLQRAIEDGLLHAVRQDVHDAVRDQCLRSLGYSSRPEVSELIEEAYEASSEARLIAALRAMARSANPIWEENILQRLHDPSPRVRFEAVRAAGDIGLHRGIPDLIELLEDVDDSVRRAAIWSLSQVGGPKASEALDSMAEEDLDDFESELLRDALDNLAFVDGTRDLFTLDLDEPRDLRA